MRIFVLGMFVLPLVACIDGAGAPPESQRRAEVAAQSLPATGGRFVGRYVVPAPADLADAAVFAVSEVRWRIANGVVTLHYDLPVGLVGGDISVTLSGTLSPGATSVQLSGNVGTGWCSAQSTVVTCGETLHNLNNLPVNQAVVEQAAAEYPGPVANRLAVASLFSSDPIGSVEFDLTTPSSSGGGGRH